MRSSGSSTMWVAPSARSGLPADVVVAVNPSYRITVCSLNASCYSIEHDPAGLPAAYPAAGTDAVKN